MVQRGRRNGGAAQSLRASVGKSSGAALPRAQGVPYAEGRVAAAEELGLRAADSLGNPVVHSLLVTLGNHAIHTVRTYNWPCSAGLSADESDVPRYLYPSRLQHSVGYGFRQWD